MPSLLKINLPEELCLALGHRDLTFSESHICQISLTFALIFTYSTLQESSRTERSKKAHQSMEEK